VPPEELELAVASIVRDCVVAAPDQVSQAAARLFGWKRQGADIQAAVTAAISRLTAAGDLESTPTGDLRVAST
jgi:hypothetical protein